MSTHEYTFPSSQGPGTTRPPIALITQLMHETKGMHHIDDMLHWIANALLQQSDVSIVQIVAIEEDRINNYRTVLRTSASHSLTRRQQTQLHQQYTQIIDQVFNQKRAVVVLPVRSILTSAAANFLEEQNIYHWMSYYVEKSILLPGTNGSENTVSTPLRLVVLLFTKQPSQQSLTRAVRFILEQAIRLATSQGLLLATAAQESQLNISMKTTIAMTKLKLSSLIPIRIQNEQWDQATNPFARVVVISDRRARQLYSLIDGEKDLGLLSQELQLSLREIVGPLQILLQLKNIAVQDRDRNVVEDERLITFLQSTNESF